MQKFKFPVFKVRALPVVLIGLAVVSFGLLITGLGFYWDDWPQLLTARLHGVWSYWAYFASDRPLSAWTHILFEPILGINPLHWQVFTLCLRVLTACAMAWALCCLWPKARRQVVFASLLFFVYPAFTQQSDAVAYHQHWFQYLLFFISIGAMVQSIRRPKQFWQWTGLSLVTLALHLTITEFFTGAELARPLIIWFLVSAQEKSFRRRLGQTLRRYAPYLLILAIYVVWRLVIWKAPDGDPHPASLITAFMADPITTIKTLAVTVYHDMAYILLRSWKGPFSLAIPKPGQRTMLVSWIVAIIAAAGSFIFMARLDDKDREDPSGKNWIWQALLLGGLVTLLGPAPIWIAGSQVVDPEFHADRFALVSMFGAALLFVALIELIGRKQLYKAAILAVLIGLCAGFHFRTSNDYRWMWTYQTRFYWQLAWRAPDIRPQTAIVAEKDFLPNQDLFAVTGAINMLYPPAPQVKGLPYWVYTLRPRYTKSLPDANKMAFATVHRTYSFSTMAKGNTVLVQFDASANHCVWVLDQADKYNPDINDLLKEAIQLTDQNLISAQPVSGYPPTDAFGKEPTHDWCYYFEKADLAAQSAGWSEVTSLGDKVQALGYSMANPDTDEPREWMPFVEGYLVTGNLPLAQQISTQILSRRPDYREMLCNTWSAAAAAETGVGRAQTTAAQAGLGCPKK
jgi:hypothetical protein